MSVNVEEDVCRVCRCPGDEEEPLFHPCQCRGSIRYIHQSCVLSWMNHNGNRAMCELCKTPLTFVPMYAENTPKQLAWWQFAWGVGKKVLEWGYSCAKVVLAIVIWVYVFPIGVFQTFSTLFSPQDVHFVASNASFFERELVHWGVGIVLVFVCLCIYIILVNIIDLVFAFYEQKFDGFLVDLEEDGFEEEEEDRVEEVVGDVVEEGLDDQVDLIEVDDHVDVDVDVDDQEQAFILFDLLFDQRDQADERQHDHHHDRQQPVQHAHQPLQPDRAPEGDFFHDILPELGGGARGIGFVISTVLVAYVACFFVLSFALYFPSLLGNTLGRQFYHGEHISLGRRLAMGYAFLVMFLSTGVSSILILDAVVPNTAAIRRELGLFHIAVAMAQAIAQAAKVSGVLALELGGFATVFGYVGDLALIPLTGSFAEGRFEIYKLWPLTSTLVHWGAGLLFMFSFSSFVAWSRRKLRAGLLWMIRDPEDPRFDPIREISNRSLATHIRRMFVSFVVYVMILLSVTLLPVLILRALNLAPIEFGQPDKMDDDKLFALYTGLPITLRAYRVFQYAPRAFLEALRWVGGLLDLRSYFFGLPNDADRHAAEEAARIAAGEPPAAADDGDDPYEHQAWCFRPPWFRTRVAVSVFLVWCLCVLYVTVCLGAPIMVGMGFKWAFPHMALSDVNYALVGASALGITYHVGTRMWAALQAVRDAVQEDAAEDVVMERRQEQMNFWRFVAKIGAVFAAGGVAMPLLCGAIFRSTVTVVTPYGQRPLTHLAAWEDDWMVGASFLALSEMLAMWMSEVPVWRLPGEAARVRGPQFRERVEQLSLWAVAHEVWRYARALVLILSVGQVASFLSGVLLGTTREHRQRLQQAAQMFIGLMWVVKGVAKSFQRKFEALHKTILDERFRVGVRLQNR